LWGGRSRLEGVLRAVCDEARVLRNVFSADTDEVLESVLGLLVGVAAGLDTVDDVLGELGVLAVAVSSSVVFAVLGADLKPCVHARRENISDLLRRVARRWVDWVGWLRWLRLGRAGGSRNRSACAVWGRRRAGSHRSGRSRMRRSR
jgi:hypothetical protein